MTSEIRSFELSTENRSGRPPRLPAFDARLREPRNRLAMLPKNRRPEICDLSR
jgi:hypothetical protein